MKRALVAALVLMPVIALGRFDSVKPTEGEINRLKLLINQYAKDAKAFETLKVYVAGGCLSSHLTISETVKVKIFMDEKRWEDALFLVKRYANKCLPEIDIVDPAYYEFAASMGAVMAYVRGGAANNYFRGTLEYSLRREMGLKK